jgi:hypothetical protein
MKPHMSGELRFCATGLCLLLMAVAAWAFLGSGLRILAPGPYEAIVTVALQMPSISPPVGGQLTGQGYVSMLGLYAITNGGEGSSSSLAIFAAAVNGDVVAAVLAWVGVGSVAAAAIIAARRSKVEDTNYRRTIDRLANVHSSIGRLIE